MVLQGTAQIQCAPSNKLGQTPSTHDISLELNQVCPPFALRPLPSPCLCLLFPIYYLLFTLCEPVTAVCIRLVLITTT